VDKAKEIMTKLDDETGFKKLVGGLFGGKAKKIAKVWQEADKKAVVSLAELYSAEEDRRLVKIVAFSTGGKLDERAVKQLESRVEDEAFAPSTVIYHVMYWSFGHWLKLTGAKTKVTSVSELSTGWPGVFTLPIGSFDEDNVEADLALWAQKGDENYAFVLPNKRLKKLLK
jgi:hypothetical protein